MANAQVKELMAAAVQQGVLNALKEDPDHSTDADSSLEPCHREREGCHHVVWRVGSYFLHALPIGPKNQKSLERDRAVTLLFQKYSKSPGIISVPSKPFKIGSWICSFQKKLPGTSFEDYHRKSPPTNKTVEGMTQFMKTLKSIPYDEAMEVCYYEHERPNLQKRVKKAIRHWAELKNIDYVQDPEGRMKTALSLPAPSLNETYKPYFLHGDLSMQHILVNEVDGTVTGMIDWSDAMLGDPCEDIAGLALSLGANAAKQISAEVGYDEHTIARGLLFAKCLGIEDLRELKCGTEQQPPEELLRAQFRMAFEGIDFGI